MASSTEASGASLALTWRAGPSGVDRGHVGVAVAGGRAGGRDLVQAAQILVAELDLGGRRVLLEVPHPLRAGDRHDVLALAHHPGERELAGLDALLTRELLEPVDDLEVALEVLTLEAREADPAGIRLEEVVRSSVAPGQEAAPER